MEQLLCGLFLIRLVSACDQQPLIPCSEARADVHFKRVCEWRRLKTEERLYHWIEAIGIRDDV